MKVKRESEVAQSCLTPSDPMDCSPPGSSIHGIFQASVLERGAIAFSEIDIYMMLKKNSNHKIGSPKEKRYMIGTKKLVPVTNNAMASDKP